MIPWVAFPPPPSGFVDTTSGPDPLAAPPLAGGAGARFTQWNALRDVSTGDVLVTACVATPIPGWVDDMRPIAQGRTTAIMAASAARVVGVPVEPREEGGHFVLRAAGAPPEAPPVGLARTFVGWDTSDVVTCFSACATPNVIGRDRDGLARGCEGSVLGAHLEGSKDPPPPGMALGAVTWGVHHPSAAVTWALAAAFALGVVAVACRKRQRSRI